MGTLKRDEPRDSVLRVFFVHVEFDRTVDPYWEAFFAKELEGK